MPENEPNSKGEVNSFQELLQEYQTFLTGRSAGTVDLYLRITRQFLTWLVAKAPNQVPFQPEQFTRTALEVYLAYLEKEKYSLSHRALVKAAASNFATFLIEEKGVLKRN